jgi:hypothetical protein
MSDEEMRAGIRAAKALSLTVTVKPHVWVDRSWAGAVAPQTEDDWRAWFANYRREIERIARLAAEERADILAIGTELTKSAQRPEWRALIAAVRGVFSGRLTYAAHNVDEALAVPFWRDLDLVGVTLYPPLGADTDRDARLSVMHKTVDALDALAQRTGRPVWVAEIGIRSAQGAAAKPWESAEERVAVPDPQLQADVLSDWLAALERPAVAGVLVWRWFTDPKAGGAHDTDFTVQGKPAEQTLRCAWTKDCAR